MTRSVPSIESAAPRNQRSQRFNGMGRILVVDDEERNRELLTDMLEASDYDVITANNGEQALQSIRSDDPDVVLLDVMMPGKDGFQVCRTSKEDPETARVPILLVTSLSDRDSRLIGIKAGANDLITKPIDREDLLLRVRNAVFTKRLIDAEKELLEKTVTGSLKILTDILGLVNPAAFSSSQTVARYVRHVASDLRVPDRWKLEAAAMLSHLGCVTVYPETMEAIFSGGPVAEDERARFDRHPLLAQRLLEGIPRLESVALVIGLQARRDIEKHSRSYEKDTVEFGAIVLSTCRELDGLLRRGKSLPEAIAAIEERPGNDPRISDSLKRLPAMARLYDKRYVLIDRLHLRMILDQDVFTTKGVLLVAKGAEVTEPVLLRLQNYHAKGSLQHGEVRVCAPA
jgi:CheY-like chemotaxis protein